MNNGKFRRKVRRFHTRNVLVLVSLVLVLATAMGATLAYLITNTEDVKNAFTPSQVTSLVVEDFEDNVKSNVKIQNTGDVSAYIRAHVVLTWKSADGTKVLPKVPVKGTDYTVDEGVLGTDWKAGADGYFYYLKEVPAGECTSVMFPAIRVAADTVEKDSEGNEYFVSIEILSSAIQSEGVNADGTAPVVLAWGAANGGSVKSVKADGTLEIVTPQPIM